MATTDLVATVMELRDTSAEMLADLSDRVDYVEIVASSLRLTDVRLSVSANCPRDADTAAVRPRILPAFKSRSPLRLSRRATPSTVDPGDTKIMLQYTR